MSSNAYWKAVLNCDRRWDNIFVYAVTSTKVWCRPSCPSRKPKRKHVLFFERYTAAEQAGFCPCQRCIPDKNPKNSDLLLIEQICETMTTESMPTLTQLAIKFNLSPYHLQRKFKNIVGITPRQYAEALRLDKFKIELKQEQAIADAVYQPGYNSSSSLSEKISLKLGMTPKVYQMSSKNLFQKCDRQKIKSY